MVYFIPVHPDTRQAALPSTPAADLAGYVREEVSAETHAAVRKAIENTSHDGGVFLHPDQTITIGRPSHAWMAARAADLAQHEADIQHIALHPDLHVQALGRLLGINREEIV